ncbi:TetR/AcrR family transcriptional regulator [Roseibium aggregatum]|uniref:TetR/AcrR family transcriptional regulator n=1 Tax=Roseibium aggregatum TaxID=187304 RepID=A0A926NYJ1_9HYPH|nr:TetR/AcrR family transcriptional regulator [Roseibium aggregatum]MBD1545960.1 TetR/AcrR family transcriptional regulator [Roseibium aggregatum]
MEQKPAKASRKPRADSARNRELLLQAAREVFSAGGPGASLEGVARKAGVGIGTLYRHFPTRDALFEAVYRGDIDRLADLAEQLSKEAGPVEALRLWLREGVEVVATKKGMMATLALATDGKQDLFAYSHQRLTAAATALLSRAVEAGEIRDDITPEDLLRALVGLCHAPDRPGWRTSVARLVDVLVDGLKRGNG